MGNLAKNKDGFVFTRDASLKTISEFNWTEAATQMTDRLPLLTSAISAALPRVEKLSNTR